MLIAGRYRCADRLGSGGMADVYAALDERRGERVALKLLLGHDAAGERDPARKELFEREFHVLSQLHHPRVVSVFDYGIAEAGPFYTMELLEGNDLAHTAPLPWRRACAVLRDVCSVLSLLHSRRLVYRDLSPRNVFCTSAGIGKLIDFGALMPVGNPEDVVGTPPFAAPEAVHRGLLDARTDLYGLGATLHFALTGQLLFPARKFEELPLLWRMSRRPPACHAPHYPRELEQLVLDLVQLDASLRPGTAGEVIDRLEAIADLDRSEEPVVARAYLATPELVERDAQLENAKHLLREASAGLGGSVLVVGAPGTGRTRFLDACILQGKLLGLTTLVARSSDSQTGPYGAVRALARQLLESDPERCLSAAGPELGVLGHAVPSLLDARGAGLAEFEDPRALRPALQAALRAWFEACAAERALLIAADDLDRLDEPSAAFLALLAASARGQRLAVLAGVDSGSDAHPMPLAVLRRAATPIVLDPLSKRATRRMLSSLFGDTPKIALLAGRVHRVAGGNPRDLLQLVQNLIDRQILRWAGSGWALPSALSADELPASQGDALRERARSLGKHGLELARLLAVSRRSALSVDDFLGLCPGKTAEVIAGLGQLVAADLVRVEGGAYRFSHPAGSEIFAASIDREALQRLHGRLALLPARSGADPLRAIQHLRWSGQEQAALDRLVAFSDASQAETKANPARFLLFTANLPKDWFELFDWGIERLHQCGGPPSAVCALQGRMAGILPTTTPHLGARHLRQLMRQLAFDVGLDLYAALEPGADEEARLQTALAEARRRWESTPEQQRGLPPPLALRQLGEIMMPAAGVAATTYDRQLLLDGPCLEPLHPLSPALRVISLLWQGVAERISGRLESALGSYTRAAALLSQPDRAGFSPSHAAYGRLGILWGVGLVQAMLGLEDCLAHAELLKQDPWYRVNGILVRMLHAYWQGEPARGDAEKERWLLCLVESSSGSWYEGTHLVAEVTAHAVAGDLDRLRAVLPDIARRAELCAGWRPVHHYALGEYHRLRGDLQRARAEHQRALTAHPACEHQIWAYAASAELQVLLALGQHAAAVEAGERYLEAATRGGLLHLAQLIRIPLARAHAEAGRADRACAAIEDVLTTFERLGVTGITHGWAHEARAQIALRAGDAARARRALEACCLHFRAELSPLGRRRCERLKDAIEAHALAAVEPPGTPAALVAAERVQTALEALRTARARAAALLQLLLEETDASAGMLCICGDLPGDAAALGLGRERAEVGELLQDLIAHLLRAKPDFEADTVTALSPPGSLTERFRPVVLQHGPAERRVVTGAALLVVAREGPFEEPAELVTAISQVLSRRSAREA